MAQNQTWLYAAIWKKALSHTNMSVFYSIDLCFARPVQAARQLPSVCRAGSCSNAMCEALLTGRNAHLAIEDVEGNQTGKVTESQI